MTTVNQDVLEGAALFARIDEIRTRYPLADPSEGSGIYGQYDKMRAELNETRARLLIACQQAGNKRQREIYGRRLNKLDELLEHMYADSDETRDVHLLLDVITRQGSGLVLAAQALQPFLHFAIARRKARGIPLGVDSTPGTVVMAHDDTEIEVRDFTFARDVEKYIVGLASGKGGKVYTEAKNDKLADLPPTQPTAPSERTAWTPTPWEYEPGDSGDSSVGMQAYPASISSSANDDEELVMIAEFHDPSYRIDKAHWTPDDVRNEADSSGEGGWREFGSGAANAERAALCVTACAGLSNEELVNLIAMGGVADNVVR